jgi:hypothetical protein
MIKKALESGVGAERAIELAGEATGPPGPGPVGRRHQPRGWFYDSAADAYAFFEAADPLAATIWVDKLTSQFVGESVGLERECAEIVQRVADEREWDVRRDVRRVGPGGTYVFDFVLTTQADPILIEAVNFRAPEILGAKAADFSGALQDHRFLAAFLVVPNHKAAAAYVPENVHIVPVGDLERKLRELDA